MASSSNESSNICSEGSIIIAKANNYLAVNLHKRLAAEKQNVFFSPFSISTALTMLFCGAKDETAKEMLNILGYDKIKAQVENIPSFFSQILATVGDKKEGYVLSYANSLLSQKDFAIKDGYKDLLEESFKALLMEVDFKNETQKVVEYINEWVKEKTNGMIPRLLDSLDSTTVMVIINAVYFKGTWMHQFDKGATYLQDFYNKGEKKNRKQVDMMHIKTRFPFVEMKKFKALRLPYKGEETAMLILLPHSNDGLAKLESSLGATFLQEITKEMVMKKVDVALPKFELEYSKPLKNTLTVLGMKRAFQRGAHFGRISDCEELQVSEVIHKAVLKVNEEGCQAAAATAVVMVACCLTLDPEFIVNHPFLFVIYDIKTNLILFMGRVDEL